MRRVLLVLGIITASVLAATIRDSSGQVTGRLNFVTFLLDDFDTATIHLLASKGLAPNIKRYFIDEGYTFTNAFATSTFGSPTRATFLTGQYPHNHGEIGGDPVVGSAPRLNEASTVATWMKRAGYRTGMIGRHLTGYGLFTAPTYIPPGWDDWQALVDPTTWSTEKYVLNVNGTLFDVGAVAAAAGVELHQVDVLAYLAGGFVQQAPAYQRPFFLLVTPTVFNRERHPGPTIYNVCPDPTIPYIGGNYWGVAQKPPARHVDTVFGDTTNFALPRPPSFNEEDVTDKPDWAQMNLPLGDADIDCLQKRYWRKLEALRGIDDMVAYVMATLQATGAATNTVVTLTSDAGDLDGEHRFPEKMPAYEEGLRVPFFMRVPWSTTPRTVSRLVLNTDLAPTFAQLAQTVPTHTVDGRSLVPLLQNPNYTPWRKIGLVEHVLADPQSGIGLMQPPTYLAARTDAAAPRIFVRYPTVTTGITGELYDLALDPYQLQNIYADTGRQAEVTRLNLWLNALRTCRGLGCALVENTY